MILRIRERWMIFSFLNHLWRNFDENKKILIIEVIGKLFVNYIFFFLQSIKKRGIKKKRKRGKGKKEK